MTYITGKNTDDERKIIVSCPVRGKEQRKEDVRAVIKRNIFSTCSNKLILKISICIHVILESLGNFGEIEKN